MAEANRLAELEQKREQEEEALAEERRRIERERKEVEQQKVMLEVEKAGVEKGGKFWKEIEGKWTQLNGKTKGAVWTIDMSGGDVVSIECSGRTGITKERYLWEAHDIRWKSQGVLEFEYKHLIKPMLWTDGKGTLTFVSENKAEFEWSAFLTSGTAKIERLDLTDE